MLNQGPGWICDAQGPKHAIEDGERGAYVVIPPARTSCPVCGSTRTGDNPIVDFTIKIPYRVRISSEI